MKIQSFRLSKVQKRKLFNYLDNYFDLFSKKIPQSKSYLINKLNQKETLTQAELTEIFSYFNKTLSYPELDKLYAKKFTKDYRLKHLPSQVIQQTLKEVIEAQVSFYLALKAYCSNPSSFLGKPKFPSYSHNEFGKPLTITNQESTVLSFDNYLTQNKIELDKTIEQIAKGKNELNYQKTKLKKNKRRVKRKLQQGKIKVKHNQDYTLASVWLSKSKKLHFLPHILTYISPKSFKEAQIQVKEGKLIVRLIYEVKENDGKTTHDNLKTQLKEKVEFVNQLNKENKNNKDETKNNINLLPELKAEILELFNQIKSGILAIDLGVVNFATLFNSHSGECVILKNRKLNKLLDKLFKLSDKYSSDKDNFLLAQLKYEYFLQTGKKFTLLPKADQDKLWKVYQKEKKNVKTNKMMRVSNKLENKKKNLIHRISRFVVNCANRNNLHTIVIGLNQGWKQNTNLFGIQRLFQQLGYTELIEKIIYKAKLLGIKVETIEESYTSKIDHLAGEPICHHNQYLGKRTDRDTFISSTGIQLNADINGSIGICLKYLNKLKTEWKLNSILDSKVSFARTKYKKGNKTELLDKTQLHQVLSPKVFDVLKI